MTELHPSRGPSHARPKLGRPLPVPAWAVTVVGGSLTALLASSANRFVIVAPFTVVIALFPIFLATLLYGAACGALASIATGRLQRRIALLGAGLGAGAGACLVLSVLVHDALVLPGIVLVLVSPGLLIARTTKLGLGATNTLCARSLIYVAGGYIPLALLLMLVNHFIHLPAEAIKIAFAAIGGGLAWVAPANVRRGSPLI